MKDINDRFMAIGCVVIMSAILMITQTDTALGHHPQHGPFGVIGGSAIENYPTCHPSSKGVYRCTEVPYPREDVAFYEIGYDVYTGICFIRAISHPVAETTKGDVLQRMRKHIEQEYDASFDHHIEQGQSVSVWHKDPDRAAIAGVGEIRYYVKAGNIAQHVEIIEEYRFVNYRGCLRSIPNPGVKDAQ